MQFSDLALSRRLEKAEGNACLQFAKARRRLFPDSGSAWMECGGAYAIFDGIDAPTTQSFGLGVFEELSALSLDVIERFFFERGAQAMHEVSPHAGVAALDLLCERGYQPAEISNILYQVMKRPANEDPGGVQVHVTGPEEQELWADINARGWTHEHPEMQGLVRQMGAIGSIREDTFCFLAEFEGQPGAAGALCIHEGVALFAGAATIPELRRRGLQAALLKARMRYTFEQGCDIAMIVTEVGSNSQRNAERQGFRIAYTRTKWRLAQGG